MKGMRSERHWLHNTTTKRELGEETLTLKQGRWHKRGAMRVNLVDLGDQEIQGGGSSFIVSKRWRGRGPVGEVVGDDLMKAQEWHHENGANEKGAMATTAAPMTQLSQRRKRCHLGATETLAQGVLGTSKLNCKFKIFMYQ